MKNGIVVYDYNVKNENCVNMDVLKTIEKILEERNITGNTYISVGDIEIETPHHYIKESDYCGDVLYLVESHTNKSPIKFAYEEEKRNTEQICNIKIDTIVFVGIKDYVKEIVYRIGIYTPNEILNIKIGYPKVKEDKFDGYQLINRIKNKS